MSEIEEIYQRGIDRMTPAEKFARMHSMLSWVRDLYVRQFRAKHGDVSEERLKWEVALRMYGSHPQARELIEQKLRDVST